MTGMIMLALVQLHRAVPGVSACSIGGITIDQAAKEADVAAIVYVESVRGPDNSAPRLAPVASPPALSSRTRPIDLRGYGATMRVYQPVFGELPAQFDVDIEARQQMERGLRAVEAGTVPPCPVGIAVAHYIAGQYYIVLFKKTESGWQSYLTFNYRIEGPELLTTKVYEQEQREWAGPWEVDLPQPLYERFFAGTGRRVYPGTDAAPLDSAVARENEVWRLDGPRVSLGTFVALLKFAHAQVSIRPPDTGDGGLAR
ncbi:MAG: hypothetical protein GEU75_10500 [Dehalococcoidia bacterium]|nr:hypothetical protein [Dehalococcoidia bacterium]